jgi:nucleotide-binding universal stress UspA family protein
MPILVPVDGSDPARAALELACEDHPSEELLVLHVVDPVRALATGGVGGFDRGMEAAQDDGERLLERAASLAADRGVDVETEIGFGAPARVILEYARLPGTERVVIGSHGRSGAARVLLGSVAETVVRRSPVPVTVAR